jgi:hypothetical protein
METQPPEKYNQLVTKRGDPTENKKCAPEAQTAHRDAAVGFHAKELLLLVFVTIDSAKHHRRWLGTLRHASMLEQHL